MINFAAECFCANIDMICALHTVPTLLHTKYMANMYLLFARVEVLDVDILRTEEALILFVGEMFDCNRTEF